MSATVTPQVVLVECPEAEESPAGASRQRAWVAILSAHLAGRPCDGARALVVGGEPAASDQFPLVVFDVLPPHWRFTEVQNRIAFYEAHGAEEYYILYPEFPMHAEVLRRDGDKLARVAEVNGYISPRTGLRFALDNGTLTVFGRDGEPLRELGVDPDAV